MTAKLAKQYSRMAQNKMTISEIARKRGVSRQAVSKYFKKYKLKPFRKSPKAFDAVAERIEYHLQCAKNLRELLEYLMEREELYSLEMAQKAISKLLRERSL
jgi:AcrR family transcriptional regulator